MNRPEKLRLEDNLYDLNEYNNAQSHDNSSKQIQMKITSNIPKISVIHATPKYLEDAIVSFTTNTHLKTYFASMPKTTYTSKSAFSKSAFEIDTETSRMVNGSENG